ncbi:hypothetical protein T439DRAFT_360940 [Meredithblackwellia eburnea MCA 4105]
MSYEVAFSSGFDWVHGGKMPGLYGGDPEGGCAGGKHSDVCFSLRLMWRDGGEGEVYAYVPIYDGFCDKSAGYNDAWGNSIERGSWSFAAGSWITITEIAILNSGPDPNGGPANGYLSVWVGDKMAFEKTNMVFRTSADVVFTSFFLLLRWE